MGKRLRGKHFKNNLENSYNVHQTHNYTKIFVDNERKMMTAFCENVILANKLKYIINGQNLSSYVQQTVVSLSKFRV